MHIPAVYHAANLLVPCGIYIQAAGHNQMARIAHRRRMRINTRCPGSAIGLQANAAKTTRVAAVALSRALPNSQVAAGGGRRGRPGRAIELRRSGDGHRLAVAVDGAGCPWGEGRGEGGGAAPPGRGGVPPRLPPRPAALHHRVFPVRLAKRHW
jgi:hypothetical protein